MKLQERIQIVTRGLTLTRILMGVIVVLLVFAGLQKCTIERAKRAEKKAAFAMDSSEAVKDSTHLVTIRALQSTSAAWERRAVQTDKMARDAIDKAMRLVSATKTNFTIRVDTGRATGSGPVTVDSADIRRAEFDVVNEPFRTQASVELPPAPAPGKIDVVTTMPNFTIEARTQCGEPNEFGIRPATVLLTMPKGLTPTINQSTQEQRVCNPLQIKRAPWWTVPVIAVAGGLGYLAGKSVGGR